MALCNKSSGASSDDGASMVKNVIWAALCFYGTHCFKLVAYKCNFYVTELVFTSCYLCSHVVIFIYSFKF